MKKKLAIIGSGISAMAVAYYLRDDYEISIFDKNNYLGGHTHTHSIQEEDRQINIDTGFIVFNKETYPNMIKMFEALGVEKQKSDMSFSVFNKLSGLQFSGTSLSHLFAQKRNLFSLEYLNFLLQINKFFKFAKEDYKEISASDETIAQYSKRKGLSKFFIDNYLAPMSAAVWSVPQNEVYNFPISLLLPFFFNHGLLGMSGQHQWYTVKGGSNTYTKKIIENANYDIHLEEEVISTVEKDDGILIKTKTSEYEFDYALLASHADEGLKIVKEISEEKKELLGFFGYNENIAILHTDESIMPPIKKVWSAWNNIIDKDSQGNFVSSTTYWMNKLEKLEAKKNYFVSINPTGSIDEEKIIKTIKYHHPNFTVENFSLQNKLEKLNQNTKLFFAGAYFKYGFHEDGMNSGLSIVEKLKMNKI